MAYWVFIYKNYEITVKNYQTAVELYVNNELIEKKKGLKLKEEITCTLPTGETVRAVVSGGLKLKCSVYVNEELIPEK